MSGSGASRGLGDRARRAAPALLAALFLAALAGPLADPGRVLATRDVPQFHLPLRASLARLAAQGLPEWNPWIAAGQPVLSDPSYSAFYPPTWLALVCSPAASLSLGALLHLAIALAGAYRLAHRLGARPAVALLAGVGYAGAGTYLSLAHALTLLLGAAWLPWSLLAADHLRAAADRRAALRPALALAAVFALTLLNGEPVTVLCCGLGAGAMALFGGARPSPAALARVAVAALLAAALAAVQLVPALARLGDSARAGGLRWERASEWSLPPVRAVELLAARVWGDPLRYEEGIHFGWGIHDRDYPFLISLYPSLTVAILALAALARRGLRARGAWLALAAVGVLLALGRHTPLYALLHRWVPPFGSVRFPEKFTLLVGAAAVFAAAIGLERLLAEREAGGRRGARLPLAIAAVAFVAALGAVAYVAREPDGVAALAVAHSGLPANADRLARALDFYRGESRATLAAAAATLAVFLVLATRRPRAGVVAALFVVLVGADLWRAHRSLLATAPASTLAPPPLVRELAGAPGRIWSASEFDQRPDLVLRGDEHEFRELRTNLARLEPWTGVTYGLAYALPVDYAISFTPPVRRATAAAAALWRTRDRERFHRLLGAWGVTHTVLHKGAEEIAAEIQAGNPRPEPARLGPSPFVLPVVRTVAAAAAHADADAALRAALAAGLPLAEREFVATNDWREERRFDATATARLTADAGDTVRVAVAAEGAALVVVAVTWDAFWIAKVDGAPATVLETAAGYLAVPVPAGARELVLRYRDPWTRVGAGITAGALALAALAAARAARSRLAAPPAPPRPPVTAERVVQSPAA